MLEQDVVNLLLMLDLTAQSESELAKVIAALKAKNDFEEITYKGFKTARSYENKIPWHKLNRETRQMPKVFRPIIEFEYDGSIFTMYMNKAQRAISFTKDSDKVQFFNFKKGWPMFEGEAFSDNLIAVVEEILEG